jgi:hypothetical protein
MKGVVGAVALAGVGANIPPETIAPEIIAMEKINK